MDTLEINISETVKTEENPAVEVKEEGNPPSVLEVNVHDDIGVSGGLV